MTVTAKDLRFNISMLFDVLNKGEEVTVTYRGRPTAKLISFDDQQHHQKDDTIFGLFKDEQSQSVDEQVRSLRKGRNFAL
jgi:prevent-host-death family protein